MKQQRGMAVLLALLLALLLTLFLLALSLILLSRRLCLRGRRPKQNSGRRYRLRPECNFSHKT